MTKEMIEQEKERKEIVFRDSRRDKESEKRSTDGYKMNSIVKYARDGEMVSVTSGQYFKNGTAKTAQLSPLKS